MDNERYDRDDRPWEDFELLWDDQPSELPEEEPYDEFPWFSSQGSRKTEASWPAEEPPRRIPPAKGQGYRPSGGPPPRKTPPQRRRKKKSPVGKIILILVLIAALCFVAYGVHYYFKIMGKINFVPDDSDGSQSSSIKPVNRTTSILLVGEDSRMEGETGQRSDSMILATLNPTTNEVILTSFMRDMYVPIPGYKSNRINTAFSKGGVELLEKTIEEDFDIQIDGYVSIDFSGFIEAVAALGDMQMELTEEEAEYMNAHPEYGWADYGTHWNLQPGWNDLDQWQFLCYARMRHLGNSDFDRTERQRKVLMTCYQQVKNCSVPQLLSLIDNVAPYITTNIRGSDLISYAYMLAGDGVNNIESLRIPVDGTYEMKKINGMDVLVPDLEANKAILQEYINNTRSNQEETAGEEEEADAHMGVMESPPVLGD